MSATEVLKCCHPSREGHIIQVAYGKSASAFVRSLVVFSRRYSTVPHAIEGKVSY